MIRDRGAMRTREHSNIRIEGDPTGRAARSGARCVQGR